MASAKHTRSIHIDAPVEKVFHHLEDPAHFIAAMPANHGATLGALNLTPKGVVTTYECKYRELGMHLTALFTRQEYVVNGRIVDHSSAGPVFQGSGHSARQAASVNPLSWPFVTTGTLLLPQSAS